MLRTLLVALLLLPASASAATLISWGALDSVAVGESTPPLQARVEDENFMGIAGLRYVFETDPACGTFAGASSVEGVTDANGVAASPPWTGLALTLSCPTRVSVEGFAEPLDLSLHVFSPDAVVMTPVPAALETVVNEAFAVTISMTESGFPVNAFLDGGFVTVGPNGSSATLTDALTSINSGNMRLRFLANDKQGRYEVVVTYRGRQLIVPVTQRVRPKG